MADQEGEMEKKDLLENLFQKEAQKEEEKEKVEEKEEEKEGEKEKEKEEEKKEKEKEKEKEEEEEEKEEKMMIKVIDVEGLADSFIPPKYTDLFIDQFGLFFHQSKPSSSSSSSSPSSPSSTTSSSSLSSSSLSTRSLSRRSLQRKEKKIEPSERNSSRSNLSINELVNPPQDSFHLADSILFADILSIKTKARAGGMAEWTIHTFPVKEKNGARVHKRVSLLLREGMRGSEYASLSSAAVLVKRFLAGMEQWKFEGKLMILINPMSGEKKAESVWTSVAHIFDLEPRLQLEVVRTERAGHATEMAEKLVVSDYCGVVFVSGDGLFHEFLNGLAKRQDFREVVKVLPMGIIPAGSGNGMAASLLSPDPLSSAFTIIKGFQRPADVAVCIQNESTRWFFLTITWGMIADLDLGSEGWRWMGPSIRYLLAPVYRLAKKRKYPGRLWYLPAESEDMTPCVSPCQTCHEPSSLSQSHFEPTSWPPFQSSDEGQSALQPSSSLPTLSGEEEFDIGGEKWRRVDGFFTMVTVCLIPSIAVDAKAAPYAHLGDGKFDILYTTEEASKPDLAIYLLSMEDETPNVSTVNYRKGRAVMLESFQSEKGRFALDGELVSYEPIRSFVVPQLIKLLSPPF